MKWWLACIVAVLGLVVVVQGLSLYEQRNYVRRDDVEQMIYDILSKSQDRDEQVLWAQVQWNSDLIIESYPPAEKKLIPYKNYWNGKLELVWENCR